MSTMQPPLDLAHHHFKQAHGDITVYGTWFRFREEGWRQVLVLMPTDETMFDCVAPYLIPLDHAYLWTVEHGDPEHAARGAYNCAEGLAMKPTPLTLSRIVSIVQDHIGDLLAIPPRPVFEPGVVGYAHMHQGGRREIREIVDDV